ncbi:MAG: aminoacetone oxidase family FAD-binding enzyme [Bacillota bacterium]|nr:aminoacetone oxidase family FAD-binding enzyme [Bacillota bacterium]
MKIVIIGAGAAGLFLANRLPESFEVIVIERQKHAGRKLAISGGGRGNITWEGIEWNDAFSAYHGAHRFVRNALQRFDPNSMRTMLRRLGLPTKSEGHRVYPATEKAQDVVDVLHRCAVKRGVTFSFGETAERIEPCGSGLSLEGSSKFSVVTDQRALVADCVVVATGGCFSSKQYDWIRDLGHEVTTIRPALAALETEWCGTHFPAGVKREVETLFSRLQGYAVETEILLPPSTGVTKPLKGDLLFTHFGLSGPLILDASRFLAKGDVVRVAMTKCSAELEDFFLGEVQRHGRETMRYFLNQVSRSPRLKEIQLAMLESGCAEAKLAEIGRAQRKQIIEHIRFLDFRVTSFHSPMLTRGGVSLREVKSSTMESRIHPGLYWVGEVLDVDGKTGGYNIQWAYASACAAADAIASR